jgi:spectinomycin phosphotransferase
VKLKGIHERDVRKFLERNFNLDIQKTSYFPIGEEGASYKVISNTGKYFCKVYNKGIPGRTSISRTKRVINFLFKAHEIHHIKNIPLPVKNKRGNVLSRFKGHPLVLYDYISGKNIKNLQSKSYSEIGSVLGIIHSFNKKEFKNIPQENLDLKWEGKMFSLIKELKKENVRKGSSKQVLRTELTQSKKTFEDVYVYLKATVHHIRKRNKDRVITHSDLHYGNIMVSKDGIYLIDWDEVMFALPEKDLMWFGNILSGPSKFNINRYFIHDYKKFKKRYTLDKTALKFYVFKRLLGDCVYFSRVVLHRNLSSKEAKGYIKEIRREVKILERWLK